MGGDGDECGINFSTIGCSLDDNNDEKIGKDKSGEKAIIIFIEKEKDNRRKKIWKKLTTMRSSNLLHGS